MPKYEAELEFIVTFTRTVEVDSEEEAQQILDAASVEEAYTNYDWEVEPHDFQKSITSLEEIEDPEDEAGA